MSSSSKPWMNHLSTDGEPWFAEFEINHGFDPDPDPDQPCQSLGSSNSLFEIPYIMNTFRIRTAAFDFDRHNFHILCTKGCVMKFTPEHCS
jgi:hypothetical protein